MERGNNPFPPNTKDQTDERKGTSLIEVVQYRDFLKALRTSRNFCPFVVTQKTY